MDIINLLFKLFMRKILSLSVIYVQILPLSSNGRKEIMEALKEILVKNEWFTEQEVEETFTPDIMKCIDECTRPRQDEIFNAFEGLKPQDVKVLIIGQDPYPDEAKAHGLAFSYRDGSIPADDSLRNIFHKIKDDLGIDNTHTNLSAWKEQGVLLLNTALTFAPNNQDFHIKAWKDFINQVISKLLKVKTEYKQPLVIMLWGAKANELKTLAYKEIKQEADYQEKYLFIRILRSSHPSNNYQACTKSICDGKIPAFKDTNYKPFKECNEFLKANGINEIRW